MQRSSRSVGPAILCALAALAAGDLWAERLPVRAFTVADGLAGDEVRVLFEDSRGFLWVGTSTGLARFDGFGFVTYSSRDGLPHPAVSAIAEDGDGRLWVGTPAGLAVMRDVRAPDGGLFETIRFRGDPLENVVRDLLPDVEGGVWVAAGSRLYHVTHSSEGLTERAVDLELEPPPDGYSEVRRLARGPDGAVWAEVTQGFVRLEPGSRPRLFTASGSVPGATLLASDRERRLYAVEKGRWLLDSAPWEGDAGAVSLPRQGVVIEGSDGEAASPRTSIGTWRGSPGLPTAGVAGIAPSADGSVWVACQEGLFHVTGHHARRFSERNGLPSDHLSAVLEDHHGTLWAGTASHGLLAVDRNGFYSYTRADGLATEAIVALVSDHAGGVVAIGSPPSSFVHTGASGGFVATRLPIPASVTIPGWGWGQVTLVDRFGEWWVPTGQGLFRFPAVDAEGLARARPLASYSLANGLGSDRVFRVFEDRRGDIWVGTFGPVTASRFDRSTERFVALTGSPGFPPRVPTAFAEDHDGRLWIGFYQGGIGYLDEAGFHFMPPGGSMPEGFVSALYVDGSGRLWMATTRSGIAWTTGEAGPDPHWNRLRTTEGLATDAACCFAEDGLGRIYVGTMAGVDRIDLGGGGIDHFDTSQGLVNNVVNCAMRDGSGDVWFGTRGGVSRLHPSARAAARPPRLLLTELRAEGDPVPIPELGARTPPPLDLPSSVRHIDLELTAVSLAPGDRVRFEYRIDGGSWSQPFSERRLHLVGLRAGRHQALVRAVTTAGAVSPEVRLAFRIQPPFWRRWWFVLFLVAVVACAVVAAHRWRLRRLKAVHAMRERIASDLHDELGLSLSRISILSEVARAAVDDPSARDRQLALIGQSARELMDVTSDVVWAVDPGSDSLRSVLGRTRRAAGDVFERDGIAFELSVTPPEADAFLDGESRRQLFLILKEAMHNARRHGGASRVALRAEVKGRVVVIEVEDDGRGFAPPRSEDGGGGKGLASMRRRAKALAGTLEIETGPGEGTRIRVVFPLAGQRGEGA